MVRASPTAFISYSWDTDEHRGWVRELAQRIRSDGVDVKLDQWETAPGDQLTEFMERGIRDHDFVVIICTPKYRERSASRESGVGYEGDIMTAEVMTRGDQRKFIPVWRSGQWEEAAPSWLVGKYRIDLSGDPYDGEQYADLVRTLRKERLKPPPIGPRASRGGGPDAAETPSEASAGEPGSVEALAEASNRRPEDTALAVAQLKRYLPDPIHRIKLHDLVVGETNAAIGRIEDLPMDGKEPDYAQRMADYEHATAGLLKLLATGAFFSDRIEHDQLWIRCVERLASRALERGGKEPWLAMQQYPTLLALYAIGLGAAAADRIEPIARVLGTIKVQENSGSLPVGAAVSSWRVLNHDIVKRAIDELKDKKTPISDHLLDVLRPAVSDLVPDEDQLQDLFDEVEYLAGLACAVHYDGAGPPGRAVWRRDRSPGTLVVRHAKALVESGLFDDQEQLAATRDAYDKSLKSSPLRF